MKYIVAWSEITYTGLGEIVKRQYTIYNNEADASMQRAFLSANNKVFEIIQSTITFYWDKPY